MACYILIIHLYILRAFSNTCSSEVYLTEAKLIFGPKDILRASVGNPWLFSRRAGSSGVMIRINKSHHKSYASKVVTRGAERQTNGCQEASAWDDPE
jgi:hypothetical protein